MLVGLADIVRKNFRESQVRICCRVRSHARKCEVKARRQDRCNVAKADRTTVQSRCGRAGERRRSKANREVCQLTAQDCRAQISDLLQQAISDTADRSVSRLVRLAPSILHKCFSITLSGRLSDPQISLMTTRRSSRRLELRYLTNHSR